MERRPDLEDLLELTPYQQQMLRFRAAHPDASAWRTQSWATIDGRLDVQNLKQWFERLVADHGILRTSFHWKSLAKPLQAVHRESALSFVFHDWSSMEPAAARARMSSLVNDDRSRSFSL